MFPARGTIRPDGLVPQYRPVSCHDVCGVIHGWNCHDACSAGNNENPRCFPELAVFLNAIVADRHSLSCSHEAAPADIRIFSLYRRRTRNVLLDDWMVKHTHPYG